MRISIPCSAMRLLQVAALLVLTSSKVQADINVGLSTAEYYRLTGQSVALYICTREMLHGGITNVMAAMSGVIVGVADGIMRVSILT